MNWKAALVLILLVAPGWAGCIFQETPPSQPPPPGRSDWAFNATQIAELNAMGLSGRGVRVAIIDTGIDLSHPDFSGFCITFWQDLVNGQAAPYDDDGHGTMMASILWGQKGGAPNASLIVIKAVDNKGQSEDSTIAAAVRLAMDPNGDDDPSDSADVISMSLGGMRFLSLGSGSESAVGEALSAGVFVVAAAGNNGQGGDVDSPASVTHAIAVGAVDINLTIASFSSVGTNDGSLIPPRRPRQDPDKKPELVAPGVDIWSAASGSGYAYISGTSPATVFVSTALALILESLPQYRRASNGGETTIVKFKQAFMDTAGKLDSQAMPHDDAYGYGLVRARDALEALSAG